MLSEDFCFFEEVPVLCPMGYQFVFGFAALIFTMLILSILLPRIFRHACSLDGNEARPFWFALYRAFAQIEKGATEIRYVCYRWIMRWMAATMLLTHSLPCFRHSSIQSTWQPRQYGN